MPLWLQNLLVLLLVAACLAWVGRQAWQSLRGRRSRLGSCCAKGCAAPEPSPQDSATDKAVPATPQRVQFIPVEMLSRRARESQKK
jgi:hypothetical protein